MNTRVAIPGYLVFAGLVLGTCGFLVRSSQFAAQPELMGWAASLDIAVLVPLVYFLMARRVNLPRITTIPVFLLSVMAGRQILPREYNGALGHLELVAVPLELGLIGYVLYQVREAGRDFRHSRTGAEHFVEDVEAMLSRITSPSRILQVAASEISILYYAFAGWRGSSAGGFSYHVKSGYAGVVGTFVFLIAIETTALHLFLLPQAPVVAWILFGLSVYGAIYLLGDFNAARRRPLRVDAETLRLRTGVRWRCDVPRELVRSVHVRPGPDLVRSALRAELWGTSNVVIELSRPVEARGLYGLVRRGDRISLWVDDPRGFAAALGKE